jgi:Xaa-Pro aminopeptidase
VFYYSQEISKANDSSHDAFLCRYFNEAKLQLDSNHWKLMKQGLPQVPTITEFIGDLAAKHHSEHSKPLRVGIDPFVHAASFAKELQDALVVDEQTVGEIDTSNPNLIDPIWGTDRPPVPKSPFRVHPIEYAGMSVAAKVQEIRKEMEPKKATLAVFCTLDDVAYLLNLRAMGDVETCPVGIAYATVSNDEITLYCDSQKVESPEVKEHLSQVTIKPYDAIVQNIQDHCADPTHKVWLDKSRANYALTSVIPPKCLVETQNAVTPMKACKNEAEMEGMRKAHIVDGAAMANFMAWLQEEIVEKGRSVSEVEIDVKLTGYRAEQPGFLEVSFPTIAGVGSNGAIIHYRAAEGTDLMKYLDTSNPILIDSGGQYTYGTTDVTRTWHFGTPTREFVDYYTRVLKGNIGLDSMIFPENTPGFVLDVFARKSLWEGGKDYGHGTGHGVGAALNVHEGPHSISPRWTNTEGLKKGMIVSNEPGYYEDGNFGIRIENLLEIAYVKPEYNDSTNAGDDATDKKFLKFEKLTLIPIQKNLINVDLMTDEELDWLDSYHELVMEKVSSLLEPESPAMAWLEKSCAKIERN